MTPHQIEAATAIGWPAQHETTIAGWRVFSGLGLVGRVNSCWPLDFDGSTIVSAIDQVEAHYRNKGLAPQFKVIVGGARSVELTDQLKARGYSVKNHTAVMVSDQPLPLPCHKVIITPTVTPEFSTFIIASSSCARDGQERNQILHRVPNPSAFGSIWVDGKIAAIGLAMLTSTSAGIGAMRTAPEYRQKGYARSILRAVAASARAASATTLWLQVETDNVSALSLYRSEGFGVAYHYKTWRLG